MGALMFFPEEYNIYLRPGITDMRKSINTLAVLVQSSMEMQSSGGDLFVFCNRRRDIIKILYWHKNGFCLWQKRLEKHKFPWPGEGEEARELEKRELEMLLTGINFFNAHEELFYGT
ncbi:MAG: IS66 family insertion sequence element accessory protein TnpB [Planctomycetota bacterium]